MKILKSNFACLLLALTSLIFSFEGYAQTCQPPTVVANPTAVCPGGSAVLTASGTGRIFWYSSPSATIPIWIGANYTTLPLFSTTTYYAAATTLLCISSRTAITVTVNPIPAAPTVSASPSTVCLGNAATLTATGPGGTYEWFNVLIGGSSIATGSSFTTPPLSASTTYFVQATINGCTGPRAIVTVTVNSTPPPAAPTASASPAAIYEGMTSALTATAPGGNYQWYDSPAGGTLLGSGASYTTASLLTTTTYYVETTLSGCTSSRTAVTVNVMPPANTCLWSVNGQHIYRPVSVGGNVGIGTSTPGVTLDVVGDIRTSGLEITSSMITPKLLTSLIVPIGPGYVSVSKLNVTDQLKVGTNSLYLGSPTPNPNVINNIWTENDDLFIQDGGLSTNGNTIINENSTGNVGIGINNPTAKLDILPSPSWISPDGSALKLRGGRIGTCGGLGTNDNTIQILFTTDAGKQAHTIKSFHGSCAGANELRFSLWNYGTDGTDDAGTLDILTLRGTNQGSVGVGTVSPLAKLHIKEGAFLVEGTTGATPVTGAGTRMMWVPDKAAFRAGSVYNTEWDAGNIEVGSVAMGINTTASGAASVAMGYSCKATGERSTAVGSHTSALAYCSIATGEQTIASGRWSTAMGSISTASGEISTAIGWHSLAEGDGSFALGNYAEAIAEYSMALGSITNDRPSSLMVGFGGTEPTFFVGPSNGSNATGNVGIGTDDPQAKLQVNQLGSDKAIRVVGVDAQGNNPTEQFLVYGDGRVFAREIKVKLGDFFPDFVFYDDYQLKSLQEVEEYIKQHGHLPGIPSQKEVAADGLNVGEFNALLLQKIEELTLYSIQQDSLIRELMRKINH